MAMTLDEVSALVKQVKEYPAEEIKQIETEISRLTILVKYTRHTKRLDRYSKKLELLSDFKSMHTVFTKEEEE